MVVELTEKQNNFSIKYQKMGKEVENEQKTETETNDNIVRVNILELTVL